MYAPAMAGATQSGGESGDGETSPGDPAPDDLVGPSGEPTQEYLGVVIYFSVTLSLWCDHATDTPLVPQPSLPLP